MSAPALTCQRLPSHSDAKSTSSAHNPPLPFPLLTAPASWLPDFAQTLQAFSHLRASTFAVPSAGNTLPKLWAGPSSSPLSDLTQVSLPDHATPSPNPLSCFIFLLSTFYHLTYCAFQLFMWFSLSFLLYPKFHNGKNFFVVHHCIPST